MRDLLCLYFALMRQEGLWGSAQATPLRGRCSALGGEKGRRGRSLPPRCPLSTPGIKALCTLQMRPFTCVANKRQTTPGSVMNTHPCVHSSHDLARKADMKQLPFSKMSEIVLCALTVLSEQEATGAYHLVARLKPTEWKATRAQT